MTKNNKPMIRIHNTETDEIIDREMTDKEFETYQNSQIALENARAEAEANSAAKAALLERLGITEDEAKLLLG
jgi:hypothetical protein